MIAPTYVVKALPRQWPGAETKLRTNSPFKENWTGTMQLLARELRHLNARDVVLHMDVQVHHLRQDGGVRADARPGPRVILAFVSGADKLSFPCDRFKWWQENVRAIALALEALRKVDRYGVRAGKQYEGFRALPPGASEGQKGPPPMEREEAAQILSEHSGLPTYVLENDVPSARVAARLARAATHPDRGGDAEEFQRVEAAIAVLVSDGLGD